MVDNTGGELVLIVDDMEVNRLVLEEIIQNMGCRPVLAESGEMAIEKIRRNCRS